MEKTKPEEIWQEYQHLQEYLTTRNVYENVKRNENFYDGKQWEGIKADNMPKPVINFLQRVVKYMIATLASNDISVSITPFSDSEADHQKMKPISNEVEKIIERAELKESSRMAIRNAAVDGSSYMMQMFDSEYETGQDMKGRIENIIVDNTNMYYGNPYSSDIQKQPYIIVALRQNVKQVRIEAEEHGVSNEDIQDIRPDDDSNQYNDDSNDLCTVLIKYYKLKNKETGKKEVWFTKTTQKVTIIEETNLGYSRYPISCFGWDPVKNSYLYNSPLTAVIPNQVFINKCFAIAQMYGLQSAFPKIVYDKAKVDIKNMLENTSPQAVVGIDTMGKFLDFIKMPDFSSKILELIDVTITQTKECMGVNDAALGNVKPDNTSAIIALQESSNVPLELQRQHFYKFWEDTIRNILDIMADSYGTRLSIVDIDGQKQIAEVNYDFLNDINWEVNVDIGNGAQFSEIAQINTLDKLFMNKVIDSATYIESVPDKYVPNKSKILENAKKVEQSLAMQGQTMNEEVL